MFFRVSKKSSIRKKPYVDQTSPKKLPQSASVRNFKELLENVQFNISLKK